MSENATASSIEPSSRGRRFITLTGLTLVVTIVNWCLAVVLMSNLAEIKELELRPVDLTEITSKIDALPEKITGTMLDAEQDQANRNPEEEEQIIQKSASEVSALFEKIGPTPDARTLAQALTELDGWAIVESDIQAVDDIRESQTNRLRETVVASVNSLEEKALNEPAARDGFQYHSLAQGVLAYYPTDTDPRKIEEIRTLLNQQAMVASKLEALQRMRYNNWASSELSRALQAHNRVRTLNPLKDNGPLIEAVGSIIAPIDPAQLEPATHAAYQFVVQKTLESLHEELKPKLVSRMTKAGVTRIRLDQF